jgi:hypothetical protein
MKRLHGFWMVSGFLLFSIGLFGQENKPNALSYSLSYIPPSFASSEGEFFFVPFFLNFEANINYKPFEVISFTSGLGYLRYQEKMPGIQYFSPFDQNSYYNEGLSVIRIPMQINLHFIKVPTKTDTYLKVVYTNGIWFLKTTQYENDEITSIERTNSYEPSIGIGIGSIFLKHKKVGIIVEGTIEKYLRYDTFNNTTWYSLKIGVVI